MDIDMTKIGLNIKRKRLELGLTQAELAELAGLSNVHISRLETGENTMSLESLLSLCGALKTTPDALLLSQYMLTNEQIATSLSNRNLSQDELEFLIEMAEQLEKRKLNRDV